MSDKVKFFILLSLFIASLALLWLANDATNNVLLD
jgi:NADH:ubiquinone oxidoreductase subunit 5 (subunit L)/multisubunit Na+/H+ antiporter MnhA subunit